MKHAVVDFSRLRFLWLKFEKIRTYIASSGAQNPLPVKRHFYNLKRKKERKKSNNVLDSTVAVLNVDHNYSLGYFTFTKVSYLTFPTITLFNLYVVFG